MRRVRIWAALVVCVVLLTPMPAMAQAKKDDNEVLVFGLLATTFSEGADVTIGTVFFNAGRFVTERMEIGGGPQFMFARVGGGEGLEGETDVTVGANFFFRQYFETQNPKLFPYVGAEFSISDFAPGEDVSVLDTSFLNGVGGVKSYLTERAALDFKGGFGFSASDPGAGQLLTFTVGLTVLF